MRDVPGREKPSIEAAARESSTLGLQPRLYQSLENSVNESERDADKFMIVLSCKATPGFPQAHVESEDRPPHVDAEVLIFGLGQVGV